MVRVNYPLRLHIRSCFESICVFCLSWKHLVTEAFLSRFTASFKTSSFPACELKHHAACPRHVEDAVLSFVVRVRLCVESGSRGGLSSPAELHSVSQHCGSLWGVLAWRTRGCISRVKGGNLTWFAPPVTEPEDREGWKRGRGRRGWAAGQKGVDETRISVQGGCL